LLAELAGLTIGAKQVERVAESLGASVACFEQQDVEEPRAPDAFTVYLSLDGTRVPMRKKEFDGRQGKQADSSAKTREVKLVTVWTAEARDKNGLPVWHKGSVSYSAAIESAAEADTAAGPSAFALRVIREAKHRAVGKGQHYLQSLSANLTLRCCGLSGRLEDTWEWKAQTDHRCLGRAA
jgi:hypothetical protein